MRQFSMFLMGSICGAVVGAVAALLLAPYSGQELRTRAADTATSIRDEVVEAYESRMAQLEAELEVLRGRIVKQEASE